MNHCYNRKAKGITQLMCVFVALGIQHAMRTRHIFICGLPRSTIYFTLPQKARFSGKKVIEHKMCVLIFLYNFCVKHFSF